jgi:ribA/ribD-fused uncharacterized protein
MSCIKEFTGKYRWLSNFWMAPVQIGKLRFPSNEHAYQVAKSLDPADWMDVLECVSPGAAKRMGQTFKLRPDWDEIKLEVMTQIVAAKFDQNPLLRDALMATKGMELVEGNGWGDRFWGVCRNVGHNHLGRIIMEYRDR